MDVIRDEILADVVGRLRALVPDWEDSDDITEMTYLLSDMNWQSINMIVLANDMQENYAQPFPFDELFESIRSKETQDITVGEWVDFIYKNLDHEYRVADEEKARR
jgi:hypothetical protein